MHCFFLLTIGKFRVKTEIGKVPHTDVLHIIFLLQNIKQLFHQIPTVGCLCISRPSQNS